MKQKKKYRWPNFFICLIPPSHCHPHGSLFQPTRSLLLLSCHYHCCHPVIVVVIIPVVVPVPHHVMVVVLIIPVAVLAWALVVVHSHLLSPTGLIIPVPLCPVSTLQAVLE